MSFKLNIDKYLNTCWQHVVSDAVRIESGSAPLDWDNPNRIKFPIPKIHCWSLPSGSSADEALAYAADLMEAASIVKQIEARFPEIEARYNEQQALREMRRERRHIEPKAARKVPRIGESRAKALVKFARERLRIWGEHVADGERELNELRVEQRLEKISGDIVWRDMAHIHRGEGKGLEVQDGRYDSMAQRDLVSQLARLKPGEVRVYVRYSVRDDDGGWDSGEELIPLPK